MSGNEEKKKFSVRIDSGLLELCDKYIEITPKLTRTELLEDALRFYLGYVTAQRTEDYLLQTLSSVLVSTIRDTENRLARMGFKMAVELSKLSHVTAYSHSISIQELEKLHAKCLEDVKKVNGTIDFEEIYKYQKRQE